MTRSEGGHGQQKDHKGISKKFQKLLTWYWPETLTQVQQDEGLTDSSWFNQSRHIKALGLSMYAIIFLHL